MADGFLKGAFPLKGKQIWIAGHRGLVGAALVRRLKREDCEVLTVGREDLDLRDPDAVNFWINQHRPDAIILSAARVGSLVANASFPVDFLHDNLMIASNVIHAAHRCDVEKLLFLGSSCIYPRLAKQPIKEDALMTGPLEPTNEAYAVAKIAGIKLCQAYRQQYGCDFISGMPCNLYGPGDRFDENTSHVIPALLLKAHRAKTKRETSFTAWGSGTPRREFLYADDAADALVFLLKSYTGERPINIGAGVDISIAALTRAIAHTVKFEGEILFDQTKPDGTPRKLIDSSCIMKAGWQPRIRLQEGLQRTYEWYQSGLPHAA
jgi:GDP-L-fucose synthase